MALPKILINRIIIPFLFFFLKHIKIFRTRNRWEVTSSSKLGAFIVILLFISPLILSYLLFFGNIYIHLFVVFPVFIKRLGVSSQLGLPLVITAIIGCFINVPIIAVTQFNKMKAEFFFMWWLNNIPLPVSNWCKYVAINVTGGVIPILFAIYQFHRTNPLDILLLTAIITLMSYFLAYNVPTRGILMQWPGFFLIILVAALFSCFLIDPGTNRTNVAVAFAGTVLGTTIGADLLHLKSSIKRHVQEKVPVNCIGSIGGSGFNDGIALSGSYALVVTEWLPIVIDKL